MIRILKRISDDLLLNYTNKGTFLVNKNDATATMNAVQNLILNMFHSEVQHEEPGDFVVLQVQLSDKEYNILYALLGLARACPLCGQLKPNCSCEHETC